MAIATFSGGRQSAARLPGRPFPINPEQGLRRGRSADRTPPLSRYGPRVRSSAIRRLPRRMNGVRVCPARAAAAAARRRRTILPKLVLCSP